MTRLFTAAVILAAIAALKLYLDSRIWREPPYIDDRDWLMEVDPYINTLGGHA